MISKAAPYIFLIGLFCIVLDGLWIVESYNSIVSYPREALVYLALGVCFVVVSYFLFKLEKPPSVEVKKGSGNQKDNRVYIRKVWDERDKLGAILVVGLFIILVIISIFDFGLAVRLLSPILFCGMVVVAFLYSMYHDGMEMEDDETLKPKTAKVRKLMSLIDYRNHFFSLSLLLFTVIICSYLITKELGYTFTEISGGMKVMTLEGGMYYLSGLIFL